MSRLYLITGFLGAGKSSFLKYFIRLFPDEKLQIIMNEFGKEGVDGVLLSDLGIGLEEITGGSVFCSCRIDQFEKALRNFVREDTDVVLVEASGLSDPTGVRNLLSETERFPHIRYCGSVCLIDAVRFPKVYAKSRTCVKQLAAADVAVINKTDLADGAQLAATRQLVKDQRPDIRVFETNFGAVDGAVLAALQQASSRADRDHMLLTADLTTRSLVVNVEDGVPGETLERFLRLFAEMTFRIKGFVRTDKGLCLVNCVGNLLSVEPYGERVPAEKIGTVVVLSGAGMPVNKYVREAVAWYPAWFSIG